MMSFRGGRLGRFSLPVSSVWLMTDVAEAKGRQDLYVKQSPQLLEVLRDIALIESVESSNRIEGVTVAARRLRPLVVENVKPRDRSEEEIQNYRRALDLIHTNAGRLPITPELLQQLHALVQDGSGDAGQWKSIDNEIIEMREGAPPLVRFQPLPAAETPEAVTELCRSYRHALDQEHVPPLVAISALILDFLCIHPFRDGNGRVSRLLTLLALCDHGYEVGRYISLERLIEEARDDYYDVLHRSSQGWHQSRHDPLPWLNFNLAILRRAYGSLEARAGEARQKPGVKRMLVEDAVAHFGAEFSFAELVRTCPGVSRDMVRRALHDLRKAGTVESLGRGPGARWRRRGNAPKKG